MSTIPELLEKWRAAVQAVNDNTDSDRSRHIGLLSLAHDAATDLINAYQGVTTQPYGAPYERHAVYMQALATVVEANMPVMKPNGYPVDGWRPMGVGEVLAESKKLAAFLLGETTDGDDD